MEHNHGIIKYTSGKSVEWKSNFRELLSRLLIEEAHRVKGKDIKKTERSFRHDTGILDRFRESRDYHIKYFRLHGVLPEAPQMVMRTKDTISIEGEAVAATAEVFALQAQFARLIGEARQYRIGERNTDSQGIDLKRVQAFAISKFLSKFEQSDIAVGSELEAYKNIASRYQSIQ
jgi:hypothetical protein